MVVTSFYVITVLEEIKPVEVMSLMCVNNGCADLNPTPGFLNFFHLHWVPHYWPLHTLYEPLI